MRLPEYPGPHLVPHRRPLPRPPHQVRELEFAQMRRAFHRTGGLAGGDEFAGRLGERLQQPVSHVARWIVSHQVLSFAWHSQTLLPLFQFDAIELTPSPSASAVVQELAGALVDWDMALWFIRPNHLLDDEAPMDALAADPASVLSAARAERFFACG